VNQPTVEGNAGHEVPTGHAGEAAPAVTRKFTAKGLATRTRIISAAAELVFAHGVARTGIEDVQQQAGVSASQMYHYFTDKNDLIRAVVAHQTDGILAAQRPVLDELDTFAALERWRDLLIDMQERRHCVGGCPIGSIAAELADDDPYARADLAAGFERWEAPQHRTPTSRPRHRPGAHPNARRRVDHHTADNRSVRNPVSGRSSASRFLCAMWLGHTVADVPRPAWSCCRRTGSTPRG
jgi:AcrR family transcriptional regulator